MTSIANQKDANIRELLHQCGQIISQMVADHFEVSQKAPGDYVTSVDAALDRYLSAAFAGLLPQDGVITEENPQSRQAYTAGYERLWCIDPLDGTENFIAGDPDYAVMIGLLNNYQPVAGWIYAPATDHLYWGGKGWGLFEQTKAVPMTELVRVKPPSLEAGACPILIGRRDAANFGTAILKHIPTANFYSVGSFGLKVLEVIQGKAGLYLYLNRRVKLWDTCAPLALAQAAGLVCCDLEGVPISFLPKFLDPDSLTHRQVILIGWHHYIEQLLPKLRAAIAVE